MELKQDTIAAIATAPGQGGIAIIRVSGPEAERILSELFFPAGQTLPLTSHLLTYGKIRQGEEVVDECMAVLMRAPKSYTREDVAELQLHGGNVTARRVLLLCLEHGARLAEPGEFTRRAFLNGRIDLSQAEAVMSVISAGGEAAQKQAQRELAGGASRFIRSGQEELMSIAAGVAACIDYPEEVSEEEAAPELENRLRSLAASLEQACDERASRLMRFGLRAVLCGRPNAGKSSLLNALAEEERAIVTDIAGTTRDTVEATLTLRGVNVCLTDTAGLRQTLDPVESLGVERSRRAFREADALLPVLDASAPFTEEDRALLRDCPLEKTLVLINKTDLADGEALRPSLADFPRLRVQAVSARDGSGLGEVKTWLADMAEVKGDPALTQPRQIDAARRARAAILRAADSLGQGLPVDLAAVDLQSAAMALGEITGDQVDEKLLDRVFEQFCVGK